MKKYPKGQIPPITVGIKENITDKIIPSLLSFL
jgi:hypothetical protein